MRSLQRKIFTLLFFFCAFSCASPTNFQLLSQREQGLKTKGGYDAYLALEYLEFSRNLAAIKNKKDSEYFAKKGLTLANGGFVLPENPVNWKADMMQMEEMIMMQKRLELVLDAPQMRLHLPIQLAHLTYLYDCWISRESTQVFRAIELAQCKVRFKKLLDELETYIDDLKKDKQPPVEIKEPEFERFEILFDLNSIKFNDRANKDVILLLKKLANLSGDYQLLIVGGADRSGSSLYNQGLAMQRAEVVKNYLTKNGVVANLISLRSVGENSPDIVTADSETAQQNRSVSIYLLKGIGDFVKYPLPLVENYIYRQEIAKARKERGLE